MFPVAPTAAYGNRVRRVGWLVTCAALLWGSGGSADSTGVPERMRAEIVATYPHDPAAFTQGLLLHDGKLYESTGLVGRSSLREVELVTGRVLRRIDVPKPYFAEGIAIVGQRLFQLTWQNHVAFVYDADTFAERERFAYPTEGWGLCFDGRNLVMSDGSHKLFVRDPRNFDASGVILVTEQNRPVQNLNELECVGTNVYANVWETDDIVRIDRQSGRVTARIRLPDLLGAAERRKADVLNGIAYDPDSDTFLVTGKFWPKVFRVRFVPAGSEAK